jgi:hypothetical protein
MASCQALIKKGHFSGTSGQRTGRQQRHLDKFTQKRIEGCRTLISNVSALQARQRQIAALLARRQSLLARLAQRSRVHSAALTSCAALSSFGRLHNLPKDVILLKLRCPGTIAGVTIGYETASGDQGTIKSGAARVGQGKPADGKVHKKTGKVEFRKLNDTSGEDVGFRLMLDPAPAAGTTFHFKVDPGNGAVPEHVDLSL